MRFRKLRIAWSAGCAVACVLVVALWVRSYWRFDGVQWRGHSIASLRGALFVNERFVPTVVPSVKLGNSRVDKTTTWSKHAHFVPVGIGTAIPDWTPVALVMTLAALPWIVRWRFSLRTLLVVMTLVAVGMGLIVFLNKPSTSPSLDVGDFTTGED